MGMKPTCSKEKRQSNETSNYAYHLNCLYGNTQPGVVIDPTRNGFKLFQGNQRTIL
jgi:hypothetical protein